MQFKPRSWSPEQRKPKGPRNSYRSVRSECNPARANGSMSFGSGKVRSNVGAR